MFSLFFYAWGEQKMVLLLIASSVVDYLSGILIDKKYKRIGLYFSLVFNIGILIYFKYTNFFINNINSLLGLAGDSIQLTSIYVVMPLGISFFTFQTMSYTIDVYRGKVKATYSFLNFITYVSLFPQLVAGPIVRFDEVRDQLIKSELSLDKFVVGAKRFIKGLFKKVFIANNIALVSDIAFEAPEGYGTVFNWIGIVAYTLTIYFDFSGYSDMAIGLGKIFGLDFPENFNYPYISKSIREFWRRWHMTMSNWFRDYVYISLGGNRNGYTIRNLIIVFLVTGLWHGASWNFVVWGLWHGVFLILERKKWVNFQGRLGNVYTMLVVMFGFVFFKADNLNNAILYLKGMFFYKPVYDVNILAFVFRVETILACLLSFVFIFPVSKRIVITNDKLRVVKGLLYFLMFFICLTYVAVGAYNPFIYFRF